MSLNDVPSARATALAYHARTVHHLSRYAKGPEALDWELQPSPFRRYEGCLEVPLLHVDSAVARGGTIAELVSRPIGAARGLKNADVLSAPAELQGLGVMLELAFGITAWKSLAGDRWPVRANPSSGNLHPVEAYVLCVNVSDLPDGVYHYCPRDHLLERRAAPLTAAPFPGGVPQLYLLLSTVPWRETWKYGERAFRYCQLDVGHAIASAGVAAAALNWRLQQVDLPWQDLQHLAGLDRREDFPKTRRPETEWEEAEVILRVETPAQVGSSAAQTSCLEVWTQRSPCLEFFGRANLVDRHPLYSWPVIAEVMSLTRPDGQMPSAPPPTAPDQQVLSAIDSPLLDAAPLLPEESRPPAHVVIRRRRSAQRFDGKVVLSRRGFERMLALTQAEMLPGGNQVTSPVFELVLWVHRVQGLEPGVYVFGPSPEAQAVESALTQLHRASPIETSLPGRLWLLAPMAPNLLGAQARALHCHQDIAALSCLTLGLFADLSALGPTGFDYRQLLRGAGQLVHKLYLGAEHEGLRGTGIGCFFDDAVAEFLGVGSTQHRSVYHFSMGKSLEDPRVEVGRAYAD
jgi:SagB-type dehydrogenase family enzyme